MPKIALIDTYYPQFLNSLILGEGSYRDELLKLLGYKFGTADFFSVNLRKLNWEAIDIVANHVPLQERWALEHDLRGVHGQDIALRQIDEFEPDVVFMQDLSYFSADQLAALGKKYLLAGQCSCPLPRRENIAAFDVIFTSFPHYVDILSGMGPKAVFLPLAFEPSVLTGTHERTHDVVFIGGVGTPSHWARGMEVLDAVAREIETVEFYGYGYSTLPESSPIRKKWKGYAWGKDMYAILQRSKICLNRHGEVSGEYANNLRMFEATGCGASLITEEKDNLHEYFPDDLVLGYESPKQAIDFIKTHLKHEKGRSEVAMQVQQHTLKHHTYAQRMPIVSEVLLAA